MLPIAFVLKNLDNNIAEGDRLCFAVTKVLQVSCEDNDFRHRVLTVPEIVFRV